jgi:Cu-processing system ATP-binding protein
LDPVATEILRRKIIKEKEKGRLILITSHVLSELDDLSSAVIYMQDGELKFHTETAELLESTGETRLSRAVANLMINKYQHAKDSEVYHK